MEETKPFKIAKQAVKIAFERVKAKILKGREQLMSGPCGRISFLIKYKILEKFDKSYK